MQTLPREPGAGSEADTGVPKAGYFGGDFTPQNSPFQNSIDF